MAAKLVTRGSVVLIRYPFTDLSGDKTRPAVVLTPDALLTKTEDALCLFISSVIPHEQLDTDLVLELEHPAFADTGLKKRSVLRAHKLALLHRDLVMRVLGAMDADIMRSIDQRLIIALGIDAEVT